MSEVLQGWKEIAAYLRRGVRTVQAWATLPIMRSAKGRNRRVWTTTGLIDIWLSRNIEKQWEEKNHRPKNS